MMALETGDDNDSPDGMGASSPNYTDYQKAVIDAVEDIDPDLAEDVRAAIQQGYDG